MIDYKALLSKEWVRLTGALLIGATIGVLFYPTKHIEEKLSKIHQEEIKTLKEQHIKYIAESDEKWSKVVNDTKVQKEETERKVSKLQEEVKSLKSKTKVSTYKLVKPDGTIEERSFTESEVDESSRVVTQIQEEFKTKIEQIETKWSEIHVERVQKLQQEFEAKESNYKKTISILEKSKVTSINEKRFGLEAGIMTNKNYYGHATMDVWGPFFVGVHGELGPKDDSNKLGAGLGLRF